MTETDPKQDDRHLPSETAGPEEPRRHPGWDEARKRLAGLPGGGLNIAYEAVDRHVDSGRGEAAAFIFVAGDSRRTVTYVELKHLSDRLAASFRRLGVQPGDRVFSLLGRRLETYVTALATLKAGAVYSPLFSTFGPEPVRARLEIGRARLLVTTEMLYKRKIEPVRASLPHLEHVVLAEASESPGSSTGAREGLIGFPDLLDRPLGQFDIARTEPDSPALLHFTSGTTGTPKGALHVHEAVVAHRETARLVFGLAPGDVYWCTADPGWVTGISYGLIAPLAIGATAIVDGDEFDAERWYEILERERVNVWYTAPTAIRMMKRTGSRLPKRMSFAHLRHMASVGEPLEPDAVRWGVEAFGLPFRDTWWQTETGAIMIANAPSTEIRPGSMGRPIPGVAAAPVRRIGSHIEIVDVGEVGELALRAGWPSMFRAYLGDPVRYQESFAGGWYLSGDLARRDEDGYFWFVGRADDAIQSAGHLIGPFEVERVMMEHPAVADAAAIGRPDPIAFEIVTVVLVLRDGESPSDELRADLRAHARRRLGPAVAPREIMFRTELPKTPSGKIIRRALREEITDPRTDRGGGEPES